MKLNEDIRTFLFQVAYAALSSFILSCFTIFTMLEKITTFPHYNYMLMFVVSILLGYLTAFLVRDLRKSFFIAIAIVIVSFVLTVIFYSIPSLKGINPALEPVVFSAVGWSMVYSILLLMAMFFGMVVGFIFHSEK